MTLLILAYLAGVLTIATPCILPILPFLAARADQPFSRGALPLLLGLALSFAGVASLAAVAGVWAVDANRHGRTVAVLLMMLFGLTMLVPALAGRIAAPIVSFGSRLSGWAGSSRTAAASGLLGVATGLLWAPCAGPVLGLILTSAALQGPGFETSFMLFAYGLGAATSMAAGMLLGGRLLTLLKRSARWGEWLRRVLGAAVIAAAVAISLGFDITLLNNWPSTNETSLEQDLIGTLPNQPLAPITAASFAVSDPVLVGPLGSLLGARQWLNSPPLGAADVRGKVVLVNFWTYSCINCLRVLPHVRGWAEKYKDRGLVVIGVHTPEFAFEKSVSNVRKAAALLDVGYPVAIDNDFRIWRAFRNQAWPALYFVGSDGRIRHQVVGEGSYAQSERLLQQLLSEADGAPITGEIIGAAGEGPQAPADPRNLRSAETYVGYAQARNFLSPGGIQRDSSTLYRAASSLPLNRWSLSGIWTVGHEFAVLNEAPGRISYRFHARDLHLVLAPLSADQAVQFRVTIDGAPPGADHGSDVDRDGWGIVDQDRLYQLVRLTGPVTDRTFEIEFFAPGIRAYAFTFG